ncbi:hypothetical protein QFC20_004411 [Naganishia adeliensis]|uniref:Uncharacterized protein n=1 Tax=Naganishia adeliensis TaxID=92952 RepID=A0ACC2W0S0_9TREE|nr:hypothetical protein QFC20_004411 [Naganishia adeliensis]
MQSSISLPATPKWPPVMISHILRSGAISQDRPIITDTPPMTTIATGYTVPPTVQDPKEAPLAVIVDRLRRRPLTHVQKLALGIIADFTLAVPSQEKAEVESLKAVTERIAEREAVTGEAVAEAELGGEGTIDTALLGTVNLAVDEPALLPAFQPQQTPKATSGEANKQQSAPARYSLRKLRLRMTYGARERNGRRRTSTIRRISGATTPLRRHEASLDCGGRNGSRLRLSQQEERKRPSSLQVHPDLRWHIWIPWNEVQGTLQSKYIDVTGGILAYWAKRGAVPRPTQDNIEEHNKFHHKENSEIAEALINKLDADKAQALRLLRDANRLDLYRVRMSHEKRRPNCERQHQAGMRRRRRSRRERGRKMLKIQGRTLLQRTRVI